MGRPFFLLSLLLVWTTNQSAQAPMTESSDYPPYLVTTTESIALIDGIRDAMFESRMDDAEEMLTMLWKRKDGMIAALYHRTEIAMTRVLTSRLDGDYDKFFEESDRLRGLLRRAPMSAGADYLKAESARQRMLVFTARGESFKAALAMKESFSEIQSLIDRHPAYYDAYKTIGLLHVTLAVMPESQRRLLHIIGLSGTLAQGARELALAADSSHFAARESKRYLAEIEDLR